MPDDGCAADGPGRVGFTARESFLAFQVNPVHHIAQVVIGAAALWASTAEARTRLSFGVGAAVTFCFIALLGFMDLPALVDLLDLSRADHWLHLLIGGAFLAAALRSRAALAMGGREREIRGVPDPGGSLGT